jgi:hypothetical protein
MILKNLNHYFRPEPSQILFQNLAYTERERVARKFISFLVMFVAVVVGSAMIFISQSVGTVPKAELCPRIFTLAEAAADTSTGSVGPQECFCKLNSANVLNVRAFYLILFYFYHFIFSKYTASTYLLCLHIPET